MEKNKTSLRKTIGILIDAMEAAPFKYNWLELRSCNCGLIAQVITGKNHTEIHNEFIGYAVTSYNKLNPPSRKNVDPTWTDMAEEFCPLTGMPKQELFKVLHDSGLTRKEIHHLEYLSDPEILERSGINVDGQYTTLETKKYLLFFKYEAPRNVHYYQDPQNLLKYLKAWAEILDENRTDESAPHIRVGDRRYYYKNRADLDFWKGLFERTEQYEAASTARDLIAKKDHEKQEA